MDSTHLTTETFSALVDAQNSFVAALIAVLPRAQRQAMAQELTVSAHRASHPVSNHLLTDWAQLARQRSEPSRK